MVFENMISSCLLSTSSADQERRPGSTQELEVSGPHLSTALQIKAAYNVDFISVSLD